MKMDWANYWSLGFISAASGLWLLFSDLRVMKLPNLQRESRGLQQVVFLLHELQETLEAGLVPQAHRWKELERLPAPWGRLASQSLQELRAQGGALMPTLKRLRTLAEEHRSSLKEAGAKSAQALAQSMICAGLVPIFGSVLYILLPGVSDRPWVWISGCALAVLSGIIGALWLMTIAECARWGGLKTAQRSWILAAQCGGERFLSLVRSGIPGDLAWTRAAELLPTSLAVEWGHSVWAAPPEAETNRGPARMITEVGSAVRKAVQVSLMEGRPCTERVESVLFAFREDVRAQVSRELSLVATRALKPLFFCVAPALLGLLVFGLFLGWQNAARDFQL